MTTRHVLVGLDGSPQSEAAALWAADWAHRLAAPLRLLHVWPWLSTHNMDRSRPGDPRPSALDALTGVAERIRHARPGLVVETALRADDPVDGLVAEARGQEMLVLGTRGLGGFAGLLVGSVSLAVAARAPIPTVLVREGTPASGTGEVVVGLDAREPADAVLEFAFTAAGLRGTALHAVHGWDPSAAWAYGGLMPPLVDLPVQQDTETAVLTQHLSARRAKHPEVEVVVDARLGGPASAVLEAATGAGLVVLGRREQRHPLGMRLGPVAHAVLHHCPVPVAVVPHA
ncbi:universal stress protein [Streptomyces sp. NRRL WC-3742]|uniref:universal stress protein n=1 Tax=Streptomyces sp. NRRL WC-3742 TaxID=1463934 RepID=UPI0004C8159F|nr:universal stress protein [Streptomyces sp. NRRL WC-3742]